MTFLVSPSVDVREFDLTTTIPDVAATPAAFAGLFHWGPLEQRLLIDSEDLQVTRLGKPSNYNGETWFSLASYLAYSGQCQTVRAGDTTGNTTSVSFTGNSLNLGLQSGNLVVQIANTSGISVGQKLFSSNASGLNPDQDSGVFVASVNSSTIILTSAPTANVASMSLIFRDNILFSAVAQEIQDKTIDWAAQSVKNAQHYTEIDGTFDPSVNYVARYPGKAGNSLRICQCDSANQFSSNTVLAPNSQINSTSSILQANVGSNTVTISVTPANTANVTQVATANTIGGSAQASLTVGDLVQVGNSSIGFQFMKVEAVGSLSSASNTFSFAITFEDPCKLVANVQMTSLRRYWEFYNLMGSAPGQSDYQLQFGNTSAQDELHLVLVDEGGYFSGTPGTVLENYKALSRATDSKNNNGTTNYYKNVLNQQSSKLWWTEDRSTATSATAAQLSSSTSSAPLNLRFYGGDDGLDEANVPLGILVNAYDFFRSAEEVDVSLIITGKPRGLAINANTQLATWVINNIAEKRKDCVVFNSPDYNTIVNNKDNISQAIVDARNTMPSSSYAFMDSGYKYMYDRYNDVYRWVPLNGDMAGLCAQTDMTNAQWWSPAGFNRGNVKNVVRLLWNPRESERDTLYPAGVNPVVRFNGQGTVLFGDKTLLAKPSAFNRINVRRLFIVLEKAIATASKYTLFEFNDEFTRSQFKAMVNPFLRDIQGRRGITGFYVRCDSINNPPFVVQNNEFIADIFIRPNYSINWIRLNFIAVPPTISFEEAEQLRF